MKAARSMRRWCIRHANRLMKQQARLNKYLPGTDKASARRLRDKVHGTKIKHFAARTS